MRRNADATPSKTRKACNPLGCRLFSCTSDAYFVLREEACEEELFDDVRPEAAFAVAGLEADLASVALERWLAAAAEVFVLREVPVHSFLLLYSFITLKSFNDTESPANNTPKIKERRNQTIREKNGHARGKNNV